jgi:hypothetical protein
MKEPLSQVHRTLTERLCTDGILTTGHFASPNPPYQSPRMEVTTFTSTTSSPLDLPGTYLPYVFVCSVPLKLPDLCTYVFGLSGPSE